MSGDRICRTLPARAAVRAALVLGLALTLVALLPGLARAVTLRLPIGGAAVELPDKKVLCSVVPHGFQIDPSRRRLTPPKDAHVGQTVEVVLGLNNCGDGAERVNVVLVGPTPVIDPGSVTVFVGARRVELRGDGLEGTRIAWSFDERSGSGPCQNVVKDKGRDVCTIDVDRAVPADPRRVVLHYAPPGSHFDSDAITYDRNGAQLNEEQLRVPVAKLLVSQIFSQLRTIDMASGEGHVKLEYPDAVANVDCGGVRCELVNGEVVVRAVPASSGTITVRLRLQPRIFLVRGDNLEAAPAEQLSVLRCPLDVASGDPPRDVDNLQVLVRLALACGKAADQIRWTAAGEVVDAKRIETLSDGVYFLLWIGRIAGDRLTLVASRPEDGTVLAVASARAWEPPPLRTSLTIPTYGEVDFIPKNRDAVLVVPALPNGGTLVPVSVPGAYTVKAAKDGFHVRGEQASGGYAALRFAYRAPRVIEPFAGAEFATLVDPLQRPIREANVPVALGVSATKPKPVFELVCSFGKGKLRAIPPGSTPHIPFAERDTCRLVIHRERIPEESGEQKLDVDVSVATLSGDRPEAKLTNHLVIRHGPGEDIMWIRGAKQQFDRISVRVTHLIDEAQYLGHGGTHAEIPSAQWTVVTENASFRFYATAAIPASLYRFSRDPQDLGSGPLSLNFGVLSRLTWLDSDGHEALIGLESGMMGMGLETDSVRQLAIVAGLGFSVPLGNLNQATQAAVNIHAWGAYTVGTHEGKLRDDNGDVTGTVKLSPWAFVFGPSITIGNVGTFL